MTCRLLTPWWYRRVTRGQQSTPGGTAPTRILDWQTDAVTELVSELDQAQPVRTLLQQAHRLVSVRVRPVYALDDQQPTSVTLLRGRGSCSQRLAVLESAARASGVPTRSRGLVVDGRFWYPRFPRLRCVLPDAVVLAWPEFLIDGRWTSATELFGTVEELSSSGPGFTNADRETLFDALARTAVDWDGQTGGCATTSTCDLSAHVVTDLGWFDSRDVLFETHGQTLSAPARRLAEPVLGRWTAGVGRKSA